MVDFFIDIFLNIILFPFPSFFFLFLSFSFLFFLFLSFSFFFFLFLSFSFFFFLFLFFLVWLDSPFYCFREWSRECGEGVVRSQS